MRLEASSASLNVDAATSANLEGKSRTYCDGSTGISGNRTVADRSSFIEKIERLSSEIIEAQNQIKQVNGSDWKKLKPEERKQLKTMLKGAIEKVSRLEAALSGRPEPWAPRWISSCKERETYLRFRLSEFRIIRAMERAGKKFELAPLAEKSEQKLIPSRVHSPVSTRSSTVSASVSDLEGTTVSTGSTLSEEGPAAEPLAIYDATGQKYTPEASCLDSNGEPSADLLTVSELEEPRPKPIELEQPREAQPAEESSETFEKIEEQNRAFMEAIRQQITLQEPGPNANNESDDLLTVSQLEEQPLVQARPLEPIELKHPEEAQPAAESSKTYDEIERDNQAFMEAIRQQIAQNESTRASFLD